MAIDDPELQQKFDEENMQHAQIFPFAEGRPVELLLAGRTVARRRVNAAVCWSLS